MFELQEMLPAERDGDSEKEEHEGNPVLSVEITSVDGGSPEGLEGTLKHDLKMLAACQKRAAGTIDSTRLENPDFQKLLAESLKSIDRAKEESNNNLKRGMSRTPSDDEVQPIVHRVRQGGEKDEKDLESDIKNNAAPTEIEGKPPEGSEEMDSTSVKITALADVNSAD